MDYFSDGCLYNQVLIDCRDESSVDEINNVPSLKRVVTEEFLDFGYDSGCFSGYFFAS